jgi:hypothetical protein
MKSVIMIARSAHLRPPCWEAENSIPFSYENRKTSIANGPEEDLFKKYSQTTD